MSTQVRKKISLLLLFTLLLASLQLPVATLPAAYAADGLNAGVYHLYFSALNASDPTKKSSMESYFVKPAKLTVDAQNNKKITMIVLKSSDTDSLKIKDQNGVYNEVTVVSSNPAANTRVIEFTVADLTQLAGARVHNTIAPPQYATNDFTFSFGTANVVPYMEDGVYSIGFTTLNASDPSKTSSMKSYFTNPATLSVQQGKRKVQMTVLKSTDTDQIQTQLDGQMVDATIVTHDTAANTRVIEFEVRALDSNLLAYVHNTIAPPQYAGNNFLFKFDPASLVLQPNTAELIGSPTVESNLALDLSFRVSGVNQSVYQQVYSQTMTVQYDPSKVELVTSASKSLINGFTLAYANQSSGVVKLTLGGPSGQSFSPNVYSASLQFKAAAVTQATYAPIVLSGIELDTGSSGKVTAADIAYSLTIKTVDKSKLTALIADAQSKLSAAVEGAYDGQYSAGAKSALQNAIQTAQTTESNATATQAQVDSAVTKLQTAVTTFTASVVSGNPAPGPSGPLADGEYKINFNLYKDGTNEQSMMAGYADLTSGRLKVSGGQMLFSFTLKNSSWITSFKTEQNSLLAESTVLSTDTAENSRVVQFPVSDLAAKLNGRVVVVVPNVVSEDQPLQIGFDKTSITPIDSNPSTIADGEYKLTFNLYKDGTNEQSMMATYADMTSGKLTVKAGQMLFSFTLLKSSWTTSFKTEQNGTLVETTVLSTNTTENSRVVQFPVSDLTVRVNSRVVVDVPNVIHEDQPLQIGFDKSSLSPFFPLDKPLPEGSYQVSFNGTSLDNSGIPMNTYVDTSGGLKVANGQNVVSFKLKTGVSITKMQRVLADQTTEDLEPVVAAAKQSGIVRVLSATQEVQFAIPDLTAKYNVYMSATENGQTVERGYQLAFSGVTSADTSAGGGNNGGSTGGNNGGSTGGTGGGSTGGTGGGSGGASGGSTVSANGFKDGKYSVVFRMLKYNTDSTSVMQEYVKSPGTLSVRGGKQFVAFTLKQSKEITDFKVMSDGSLTDTSIVSSDDKANTRVVEFEVPDLTAKLAGWVKIVWPEMSYNHSYDVHLAFDKASVTAISENAVLGGGGSSAVQETLKDGDHTLDFKVNIFHSNALSRLNGLFVHPATLTLKDKKTYVTLVLTSSKSVSGFKLKLGSELIDPETVETDEINETRTYKFEVTDLTEAITGWAETVSADGTKETHDIELVFDPESIDKKPGEEETKEEPAAQQPVRPGAAKPAATDIEGHWAKAAIEQAVAEGIVNGYEDGSFRPNGAVSRAEFTVMLSRALKLAGAAAELAFTDNDRIPAWAKPSLQQAVGAGIVSSYEDGTFRSDRNISRAEIAVMIVRALSQSAESAGDAPFADAKEIPSWAQPHVATAFKLGLVSGRDNNMFAPNANATRAEAVTLILALLKQKK